MKVFVYGTLKRGLWNHRHLNRAGQSKFISAGEAHGLDLYQDQIPYAVFGKGIVYGEIYEVSEETLKNLDELEGVDEGWYSRERILISAENATVECFIYIFRGELGGLTHLPSGRFTGT